MGISSKISDELSMLDRQATHITTQYEIEMMQIVARRQLLLQAYKLITPEMETLVDQLGISLKVG